MSAEDHIIHGFHGDQSSTTLSSIIASATSSVTAAAASSASATSSASCVPIVVAPSTEPIVGSISFHTLAIYIAGPATLIACAVALWLTISHATHCYRVNEQKLLLRVIVILPVYAILYLVSLIFYPTYVYLQNVPKVVEAVAFCALFQLCVEYVAGHDKDQQDLYFMNLERYKKRSFISRIRHPKAPEELLHRHGSLRWFKGVTAAIVQFPVVYALWTPIYIIATAVICPGSKHASLLKVLDSVINGLTTTVAILGLFRFYMRLRPDLKSHHAVRKVFILKKVIGVALTQAFIIGIVSGVGAIQPTATMSLGDFTVGIPAFMTCCEMMLFGGTFAWAYNASEYKQLAHQVDREGLLPPSAEKRDGYDSNPIHKTSFLGCIWAALNIWDLLKLIARSIAFLASIPGGQKKYSAVGAEHMYQQQQQQDPGNYSSALGYGGMAPPQQPEPYHPTVPIIGAHNHPNGPAAGTQASWTGPAYSAEEQQHLAGSNNPYESGYAEGGLAPAGSSGSPYGSRDASPARGQRPSREGY